MILLIVAVCGLCFLSGLLTGLALARTAREWCT